MPIRPKPKKVYLTIDEILSIEKLITIKIESLVNKANSDRKTGTARESYRSRAKRYAGIRERLVGARVAKQIPIEDKLTADERALFDFMKENEGDEETIIYTTIEMGKKKYYQNMMSKQQLQEAYDKCSKNGTINKVIAAYLKSGGVKNGNHRDF